MNYAGFFLTILSIKNILKNLPSLKKISQVIKVLGDNCLLLHLVGCVFKHHFSADHIRIQYLFSLLCLCSSNSKDCFSFHPFSLNEADMPFHNCSLNSLIIQQMVYFALALKCKAHVTSKTFLPFCNPFYILFVMKQCEHFICWDMFVYSCNISYMIYMYVLNLHMSLFYLFFSLFSDNNIIEYTNVSIATKYPISTK